MTLFATSHITFSVLFNFIVGFIPFFYKLLPLLTSQSPLSTIHGFRHFSDLLLLIHTIGFQ